MDKTIPAPAAVLLDFIGQTEAPRGYDTIYGNNQKKLRVQITSMTIAALQASQGTFSSRYGSSASGRYQFMRNTLAGLITELKLPETMIFNADLQDRLGYHLLIRRGYEAFIDGRIGPVEFGKRLAQEWASFPVLAPTKGAHRQLARGQSYYEGDRLNKALVSAMAIEQLLVLVKDVAAKPVTPAKPAKEPMTVAEKVAVGVGCVVPPAAGVAVAVDPSIIGEGATTIVDGTKGAETIIEQVQPVTDTLTLLGKYGPYIAGTVVGIIVLAFVGIALYKWAKR